MRTVVVRPGPTRLVVGVVLAAVGGTLVAAGLGPAVGAVTAGVAVLAFLAVAGHHRVEVGPTVRAVTWSSTGEVARSRVEAVRRAGQGRPTRLVTIDGDDDDPVVVPTFVSARRVARALDVPLLTPFGDVVDRRAELRALAWVAGGIVAVVALIVLLGLTA